MFVSSFQDNDNDHRTGLIKKEKTFFREYLIRFGSSFSSENLFDIRSSIVLIKSIGHELTNVDMRYVKS